MGAVGAGGCAVILLGLDLDLVFQRHGLSGASSRVLLLDGLHLLVSGPFLDELKARDSLIVSPVEALWGGCLVSSLGWVGMGGAIHKYTHTYSTSVTIHASPLLSSPRLASFLHLPQREPLLSHRIF
jgi:hypothetical protein